MKKLYGVLFTFFTIASANIDEYQKEIEEINADPLEEFKVDSLAEPTVTPAERIDEMFEEVIAEKKKGAQKRISDEPCFCSFLKLEGNKDVSCTLNGKVRFESGYGVNTKNLNRQSSAIDQFFVPGRDTIDLGFGFVAGENHFDRSVIKIAIDLRSRSTWGKPDEVAYTTKSYITEGACSYGEHNHEIGVPMIYVRGLDFTIDLNALLGKGATELQFLKFGFFPFEVGRGIALGAAYAVTPDFVAYDPSIVIQEFAPGFLLYGVLNDEKTINYKMYLGIFRNESSSISDVTKNTKAKQFGMALFPERGYGCFNMVGAGQLNWYLRKEPCNDVVVSPYVIAYHESEGKVDIPADSSANLTTLGFAFEGAHGNFEFGFDFAKNIGTQYVFGIDRNTITHDQRTITVGTNPYTSSAVMVNSKVTYTGDTNTTDIKDKATVYLGETSERQGAIAGVFQNACNNGAAIPFPASGPFIMKNANDRFRNPYQNNLCGWMIVADAAYTFLQSDTPVKLAITAGAASGDENPNKPLHSPDDYMRDSNYEGFLGLQEIYQGKRVRSVFFLSGSGKVSRVLSIPPEEAIGEEPVAVGFPSNVSRFTNLLFEGASIDFTIEAERYSVRITPNILFFQQMVPPIIYDKNIAKRIGTNEIPSFLGCEVNSFFEVNVKEVDGLKFFGVATLFFPGSYYSVLKQIPVNSKQLQYMNALEKNNPTGYSPMMSDNTAFYFNIGLEMKF